MRFKSITLRQDFEIKELYTVHYFEYMSDFSYPGETHDFWEFLCVDKGEAEVTAADTRLTLKKGEIIFHKPNEFHALRANGVTAPNLVVISFSCHSPAMTFFENRKLLLDKKEQSLIAAVIAETRNSFSSALNDPYLNTLTRSANAPAGSEQLIRLYLEQLMILLYRRCTDGAVSSADSANVDAASPGSDSFLYHKVAQYLELHIQDTLTVDTICRDNLLGRSQLHKLYHDRHGCGVIDYFSRLKIEKSKQLIREKSLNFTQISDSLGYSSVHYFSRQFKKLTGMTPTEYATSIKALAEAGPDRS